MLIVDDKNYICLCFHIAKLSNVQKRLYIQDLQIFTTIKKNVKNFEKHDSIEMAFILHSQVMMACNYMW